MAHWPERGGAFSRDAIESFPNGTASVWR